MTKTSYGFRESDLAGREVSLTSWLGFLGPTLGKDLVDLYTEGTVGKFILSPRLLTGLALRRLVAQGVVLDKGEGPIASGTYELADPDAPKIPRILSNWHLANSYCLPQ